MVETLFAERDARGRLEETDEEDDEEKTGEKTQEMMMKKRKTVYRKD